MTVQKKRVIYTVATPQAKFIRMKSTSKKRTPNIVNLTVKRRYLTEREIERLMDYARKHGRYGHRDATMILVVYRHGLRASEVCYRLVRSARFSLGVMGRIGAFRVLSCLVA